MTTSSAARRLLSALLDTLKSRDKLLMLHPDLDEETHKPKEFVFVNVRHSFNTHRLNFDIIPRLFVSEKENELEYWMVELIQYNVARYPEKDVV
ncbi:hypothetical protein CEXT_725881 [Caerostris extrusa]|uniref:Uncharacterized protein n=1 Tax=Caerostris extrusa TaxID=172846 RepID=A0AAV4XV39_CAEEX|nr:hypothetical protein CEXT_725881 [Caerostris extrusa]